MHDLLIHEFTAREACRGTNDPNGITHPVQSTRRVTAKRVQLAGSWVRRLRLATSKAA